MGLIRPLILWSESLLQIGFSFLIVAFGQSSWIPLLGRVAACCGFALFWKGMLHWESKKARFWMATFWFAAVQGVQLSWMTSTHYVGSFVLAVYVVLIFLLGIQFGFTSSLIPFKKECPWSLCFGISGMWVVMEWSRLFFLTGFTWNPVGLSLGCSKLAIQMASLGGVYALSFWVVFVNLTAVKLLFYHPTIRKVSVWMILAFTPYIFGHIYQNWTLRHQSVSQTLAVGLLDTQALVEEKIRDVTKLDAFVPPLEQWKRVWRAFCLDKKLDLAILPEGAFSMEAHRPYYAWEELEKEWALCFGQQAIEAFPSLRAPLAVSYSRWDGKSEWFVTNAFLAQGLANFIQAEVILGMNEKENGDFYNTALHFMPGGKEIHRYEKQILVPVGEYLPFEDWDWLSSWVLKSFGIGDSFRAGKCAKVFRGAVCMGTPICLEETYSGLVREFRAQGAELLISLSNDVWFLGSKLSQQHFDHGRIRAVENGVYLLRSSNMGVSGGVDCFGQKMETLCLSPDGEKEKVLYMEIPVSAYLTPYTLWGNWAILLVSLGCISWMTVSLFFKHKRPS